MSAALKGPYDLFIKPLSRAFKEVLPAAALSIGAAATAFMPAAGIAQTMQAQPAAANVNVQATPVAFQTIDGSTRSIRVVQAGASEASRDKIAIVVWGGNRELQQQAYNAALDLRDQGIPLAFIVGPSRMPYDNAIMIDIYGKGVPVSDLTVGAQRIAALRPTLSAQGMQAYGRMFPRELAMLSPQ
ncbi:hypothetical protein [Altericroceibacterium spongiae]|nr:hypothetical protein [Altericroceibacterium spongiae]